MIGERLPHRHQQGRLQSGRRPEPSAAPASSGTAAFKQGRLIAVRGKLRVYMSAVIDGLGPVLLILLS